MTDVAVIGGGVTGCAVARMLTRYKLSVAVFEREEDVGAGTSKANSAIVHAGYDAVPGSLKARFNVQGNAMMDQLCRDLDIPFKRNGSLVLAFDEADKTTLNTLLRRGIDNGVPDLKIISGDAARAMEPALSGEVIAALYAPTGGIICPFELCEALAENARDNGAIFYLNTAIERIERVGDIWRLHTARGAYTARVIVCCAGVHAAFFHNAVCDAPITVGPRRGQYQLLDKKVCALVSHTIFQAPGPLGKGILVTPTVHGNLLLGPTAEDIEDCEDTATTAAGLRQVADIARRSVPDLPLGQVITSFAGLRAHLTQGGNDFIVGESAPDFFEAAGIESPGLSAAPAIGAYLADMIAKKLFAAPNADFKPTRQVIRPREMDFESRQKLIAQSPAYGNIICRCEQVSEGEIVDAIRRGARSMDGVKRRTRAGMGRCQGGFCGVRVMELLRRELGEDFEVTKCGEGSSMAEGGCDNANA